MNLLGGQGITNNRILYFKYQKRYWKEGKAKEDSR